MNWRRRMRPAGAALVRGARLAGLGALVAVPAAVRPLAAQLPSLPRAGVPPIRLSGELGSFGELYNRSGAPGRRPGGTGRIYLNGNAVLFGSIRLGMNLMVSTEDGTSLGYGGLPGRQSISQLGLHPEWKWGRGHLGAFSESYSPFTYNGLQLRGVAVDLHPGLLRVGAFGGHAAGAVYGGASNGAYKRTVAGGRLGYGNQAMGRPSTFVEIMAVRAWDDPNSLPAPDTTLPPNAPVANGFVPVNPYAVTPQENLVVGVSGGLALLKGKVAWRGELAGAVHSRDVRATELDTALADVPGVVRGLITPRVGTHADYALSTELQARNVRLPGATPSAPRSLTATLGYRRIGPGYTALAVASPSNDIQAVDVRTSIRFARWSAQLQGGRQHDNLVGQKVATTTRWRLSSSVAVRMTRRWNVSLRSSMLTMGNGSSDTLRSIAYHTRSIGMGHSYAFGPGHRLQALTVDADYQMAGDPNPRRRSTDFTAFSTSARLTIRVAPAVQLGPNVGFTRSRSDTLAAVTRATYGMGAAWRLMGGRLTTTGFIGRSRYSRTSNWTGAATATFHLTPRDDLVLGAQLNRYRDTAVPGNAFDEQMINLRWARRL